MIRVLVVDDSAVVRQVLSSELGKQDGIDVVGTAVDAFLARDKIVRLQPDVVTLDLEMPRMDGLTFLKKLMKYHPVPVIVVSSLTREGSRTALRALELGAVDVVGKPAAGESVADIIETLAEKIHAAAQMRMDRPVSAPVAAEDTPTPKASSGFLPDASTIIGIGASTGGTEAIRNVLVGLPADTPGILIVQHLPAHFTASFAERLNQLCLMNVREATNGEQIGPGTVLVAPGDHHMAIRRRGTNYIVEIKGGPKVFHQRPSIDVLFRSMAHHVGSSAVGAILTGMGADGARGLLAMRDAGAYTVAQDEASCAVFGMPKEAVRLGAATKVVSLPHVSQHILDVLAQRNARQFRRSG
jgi:two-component system, chemotaxis family, protein-glutamate methylesterase/glutaminase